MILLSLEWLVAARTVKKTECIITEQFRMSGWESGWIDGRASGRSRFAEPGRIVGVPAGDFGAWSSEEVFRLFKRLNIVGK